jgi:hypothetical protein
VLGQLTNKSTKTKEINMEINLHDVIKIEVKPRKDIVNFHTRDIVFHYKDYCKETSKDIINEFIVSSFSKDKKIINKLIYSK